jgi:hypothetical protein
MYNIVKENQNLFIELASVLNAKGANIEMEGSFQNGEFIYSNMPEVRGYMGPEGEGFYFRANRRYFGLSEMEFANLFPINIDGYNCRMASFSDYEVEFDGDRSYPESISFIIEKEGKNILS